MSGFVMIISSSTQYKGLFDTLFGSFSGVRFQVPKRSRNCRVHVYWIMWCSSQMPPSGPTQPSPNCGESDCCWLTAVSLPRNCPWLHEIASVKVTPLPEDGLEPVISWCGDIKTGSFASIWRNPEDSAQSPGSPKGSSAKASVAAALWVSFLGSILPSSLPHKGISQDHSPINLLHTSVSEPASGNPI